jgi:hypothetical protein
MEKKRIKQEISKLKQAESNLLIKFAVEAHTCSEAQLRYISKKLFEISDLILRLEDALEEIRNER